MLVAKELLFFFGTTTRAHTVVLSVSKVFMMERGGKEAFAHVVGWPALVVAARPLERGCFSWVRVNADVAAEVTMKSPTRQIDKNLTSMFQLAMVERFLGALANGIGSCVEEETVVVVLSSGVVMVVAELVLLAMIGQSFGWKNSCVWVAVVRW
jgi:hypothetical protein